MGGIFDGLQVLELSWGIAGPMAGMLLVDQGATVTRIEAPDDPFATHPGHRVWNRGKRSAVLDLREEADREAFLALADRADLVLETYRPGTLDRLGVGPDTLRARNPRLVTCSLTAYGAGNEHSDRPGYEALVAARTGSHWAQRGGLMSTGDLGLPEVEIPEGADLAARPEGPIFTSSPWMSIHGFYHTSLAIAAALVARERTGVGQHVEASMLNRAAFGPQAAAPTATSGNNQTGATGGSWMQLKGAPRGLFECKDGRWVHQWPIKPLRIIEVGEFDRIEDAPAPIYDHIRTDPARVGMEAHVIIELFHWFPLMQAAFKKFTAQEWADWGLRVKEGVQIVRPPEEALGDPLLLEDGSVVEVDDPELGPIRHIGIINEFSRTPGKVRGPAPRRGQHTDEVLAEIKAAGPAPAAAPVAAPPGNRGPLAGVKVVDLGLALAGPYGSSLLADLGADVIKVNARWDGPWMSMGISGMANRGKRSAMLDLRDPLGKQAVYELVKSADIVTHNMRNGVVERMGISYDDLIKINPSIIYCESRGFDRVRSATNIPGTDQSGSALAGQEWEDGGMWNGGKPFLGTSMGDLGNGFLVAIACTQALYHRDRTGEGQFVGTSILNACLATSSYTYVDAEGRGAERPKLDKLQLGLNSLYRLYETAEGWVCVAIVKPKHWQAFCDATGRPELATDERFADAAARAKYDEELGGILEEVFTGRTAAEWFSTLDAAGVPIEISAQGMVTARHDQPFLGFSATPAIVPGASPVFGAHTREILLEIGTFTDEQIDNLTEQALAASAL